MGRNKRTYGAMAGQALNTAFNAVLVILLSPCVAFASWPAPGNFDGPSPTMLTMTSANLQPTSSSKYKIVFIANGGKGAMKSQTAKCGEKAALNANDFTRSGYKFAGWNTKANGKGKAYKDKAKVKNLAKAGKTVTLYAQWNQANSVYKGSNARDVPVKVGKTTYRSEQVVISGRYSCRILVTENGTTSVLATDTGASFLTDGRYIFYTKYLSKTSLAWPYDTDYAIYRRDLKTNSEKRLVTGPSRVLLGSNGEYLYYGIDKGAEGVDLYALNVAKGSKRYMTNHVGGVSCGNGHVVTQCNHGQLSNTPVYVFKEDGTDRRKIADACYASIKGGKVHYSIMRWDANWRAEFRTYSCTFAGKNKKAITGWSSKHA